MQTPLDIPTNSQYWTAYDLEKLGITVQPITQKEFFPNWNDHLPPIIQNKFPTFLSSHWNYKRDLVDVLAEGKSDTNILLSFFHGVQSSLGFGPVNEGVEEARKGDYLALLLRALDLDDPDYQRSLHRYVPQYTDSLTLTIGEVRIDCHETLWLEGPGQRRCLELVIPSSEIWEPFAVAPEDLNAQVAATLMAAAQKNMNTRATEVQSIKEMDVIYGLAPQGSLTLLTFYKLEVNHEWLSSIGKSDVSSLAAANEAPTLFVYAPQYTENEEGYRYSQIGNEGATARKELTIGLLNLRCLLNEQK